MSDKPITIIEIIQEMTVAINKEDIPAMAKASNKINSVDMPHEHKKIYMTFFNEIGGVTQACAVLKQFNK